MRTSTRSTHLIAAVETGNGDANRSSVTHNYRDARAMSAKELRKKKLVLYFYDAFECEHLEIIVSIFCCVRALNERLINSCFVDESKFVRTRDKSKSPLTSNTDSCFV